ncbi:CIA30 family protein [bacterium]|nr:CIA30 family protein [bacterium]
MLRTILAVLVLLAVTTAYAAVDVPLQNLKPAVTSGFAAKASTAAGGVTFAFKKTGDERRLLAVEGAPAGNLSGALAAEVKYQVSVTTGEAPRLAVIAWDSDGGSWYKVGARSVKTDGAGVGRVSTAGLIQTAFSTDASGQLEWGNVKRLWVGFIFDGPAAGSAAVTGVRLTDIPVVPTEPVAIINVAAKFGDSHDPAAKTTISAPAEGPGGKTCFKYEFDVPAGKHMFACPSTAIIADDLEGYKALRFQIKGDIPQGMRLLIQFSEQGGPIYFVEKQPSDVPANWAEMTIPLSEFKNATWGPKDDNGQLDLAKLNTLSIGSHGVPANARLGTIMACDVVLVP